MNKRKKKYREMNANELAAATKKFDRPGVAKTFRPLTPAEEAAWRAKVKRPLGRPRNSGGT